MLAWLSDWSEVPLIVSCFSKIQIGFTFLVPAHPGSPGQRVLRRVCVCVGSTVLDTIVVRARTIVHLNPSGTCPTTATLPVHPRL